jgi:hypothetical protein
MVMDWMLLIRVAVLLDLRKLLRTEEEKRSPD